MEVKRAEHKTNHSTPTSADVMGEKKAE